MRKSRIRQEKSKINKIVIRKWKLYDQQSRSSEKSNKTEKLKVVFQVKITLKFLVKRVRAEQGEAGGNLAGLCQR